MDAREQLRRYLEQRRELGETELVLDGMTVEEVLRIVGAGRASSGGTGRRERVVGAPATPAAPRTRAAADEPPAYEAPPPDEPPPPDADDTAPSDWRAALRQAGAAPATPGRAPSVPPRVDAPVPAPPPARDVESAPPPPAAPPAAAVVDLGQTIAPPGIAVGTTSAELFGGPMSQLTSLEAIAAAVAGCTRCPLYKSALNPVPGVGNPNADLVCVGEAPGATEDERGEPFVGQAGQLLNKILAAIQLKREDVYICNVLKHRPPGNRNPAPSEVEACSPYLVRQLELIRPKVILALGTFAAQTLLDTKLSIGKLRGQMHRYYGIPLIVTYHPAALLRNPSWKRPTWEDVQLARRILDRAAAGA
jgi:uracil-DNA glycosylase